MPPLYYTPQEVADRLAVSPDTVMRRIHAGDLPALRVSERVYRIPIAAFERWEEGWRAPQRQVVVAATDAWEEIGAEERVPDGAMILAR